MDEERRMFRETDKLIREMHEEFVGLRSITTNMLDRLERGEREFIDYKNDYRAHVASNDSRLLQIEITIAKIACPYADNVKKNTNDISENKLAIREIQTKQKITFFIIGALVVEAIRKFFILMK